MRKRTVCLLAILLLAVIAGSAGAEFKFVHAPKAQVFQVDLSDLVRDIPAFPQVSWIKNHVVISGLSAWNVDRKHFHTYDFVKDYRGIDCLVARDDSLEDEIIIYGNAKKLMKLYGGEFTAFGGKMELRLHFTSTHISQDTFWFELLEKKKNSASYLFYPDGRVSVWSGSAYMANYENGILQSGEYYLVKPKIKANYVIQNGGQIDGEYWYVLTSISEILIKQGDNWKPYRGNVWHTTGGWDDPKDKTIAGLGPDRLPFSLASAARTPFRMLKPVMYARDDVTAEKLACPALDRNEPRLFYTLASLGLPAMPGISKETDPDGNSVLRLTGMQRWGMPEDEIVLMSGATLSFYPDIPGIKKIKVSRHDFYDLHIEIQRTENGTLQCYQEGRKITVDCPCKPAVHFGYCDGYLTGYHLLLDNYLLTYGPAVPVNGTTLSAGIRPEFACIYVQYIRDGSVSYYWDLRNIRWRGRHGQKTDGAPLSLDPAKIPPALTAP